MKIFIIDTGYFFTYIVLVKTRITIDKAKFGQMWNFSGGQIRWQQQIFPKWHARWFYNLFIVLWELGKLRVVRLENRKKNAVLEAFPLKVPNNHHSVGRGIKQKHHSPHS